MQARHSRDWAPVLHFLFLACRLRQIPGVAGGFRRAGFMAARLVQVAIRTSIARVVPPLRSLRSRERGSLIRCGRLPSLGVLRTAGGQGHSLSCGAESWVLRPEALMSVQSR
ncbi:hypothetical protein MRX96_017022 [Rhipicephalus microplus]